MHEQCMQLNVWLLIEIQIENTLGLMNEKSNSLKSDAVERLRTVSHIKDFSLEKVKLEAATEWNVRSGRN